MANVRDQLVTELRLFGARNVVISTNVPTRRDGMLYATFREPDDSGVAIYWTDQNGGQRVIACDAWATVRENMRAIGTTISALRMIQRAHAGEILNRAFEGFAYLPQNAGGVSNVHPDDWREALGFGRFDTPNFETVTSRFRELARKAHPDNGGTHATAVRLNQAYQHAKAELQ